MTKLFNQIYKGKTVLVTGHSGFKGSWLSYWLVKMGAKVIGYSLEAPTYPNHFALLNINIISIVGNIGDEEHLNSVFMEYKPDIVFHLAAQALVRFSYENPIETYETNVLGTLKVFEASRKAKVKAIVNITSDKAYENQECLWGYRENDPMGGYDPYSSSKGCAELLTSSYRNSYFNINKYGTEHQTLLASCRAGNVIGGGDWAKDRLMTDIILAIVNQKKVHIRSPKATRPWQHVLEPLSGYLRVGQKLLEKDVAFSEGFNFGPSDEGSISVESMVQKIKEHWSSLEYVIDKDENQVHEAILLKLDCSKAHQLLQWHSVWDSQKTFEYTVKWYKDFYENEKISTEENLESYIEEAKKKGLVWAVN